MKKKKYLIQGIKTAYKRSIEKTNDLNRHLEMARNSIVAIEFDIEQEKIQFNKIVNMAIENNCLSDIV